MHLLIIISLMVTAIWGQTPTGWGRLIYGAYTMDPVVAVITDPPLADVIRSNPCNRGSLDRVYNQFRQLDASLQPLAESDHLNVAICAVDGMYTARVLMGKMVYPYHNTTLLTDANRLVKRVIYDPQYMIQLGHWGREWFMAVPDSHPDYMAVVQRLLPQYPDLFHAVTLRYKRHPWVTQTLFDAKSSYDDPYKHIAIQYTTDSDQQRQFVAHNGLLYAELPIEHRQNAYLAYKAFVQNEAIAPYIPQSVIALFQSNGVLRVPRYMSVVIMAWQGMVRQWTSLWAMLYATITRQSDGQNADLALMMGDDGTMYAHDSDGMTTDHYGASVDDAAKASVIPFYNERTVVTDTAIINAIESRKNRRLMNMWRIARFGDEGHIFVAMFRPNGKDYLGAIIIKQGSRYMLSEYESIFTMDGQSIWRVNDNGTLSARSFQVQQIRKSPKGTWVFDMDWAGEEITNQFQLIDDGGALTKTFTNYYFNQ
jgi:hypothetical protein